MIRINIRIYLGMILLAPLLVQADQSVLVQSTTSTANSGLYEYLLPQFEARENIQVNVVAVGTGQAIRNAQKCDADVLLVHARSSEEEFVKNGGGVQRHDLMYNDFVVVGPSSDPANLRELVSIDAALKSIASTKSLFTSRGDDSGTHKKELELWKLAAVDPVEYSGLWYLETGSGMGATLTTAIGKQAYALTDRATWISFQNKMDFEILLSGDPLLFNQYGVIMVNPEKCPGVNEPGAKKFINWLLSENGQQAIAAYRVSGQQLFYPNGVSQ